MSYTTDQIQAKIDKYNQAEDEILGGKTVTWNGRTLTMENLPDIIEGRSIWEKRLSRRISGRSSRQPAVSRFS
jgi:hypothetical protein